MILDVDENDVRNGVLGLLLALVETNKETLRFQVTKRLEAGSLTELEAERLGGALMDLQAAIDRTKVELGVARSEQAVRDELDMAVDDAIDPLLNPVEGLKSVGWDGDY